MKKAYNLLTLRETNYSAWSSVYYSQRSKLLINAESDRSCVYFVVLGGFHTTIRVKKKDL